MAAGTDVARAATSAASPHGHRFSETLHRIRERARHGALSVHDLLEISGPQGHAFLAVFLMLPFLQPIPLPGISTVLGLVVAMLGVFAALDRAPWVPRRLARVTIDPRTIDRICSALERLLARLERFIRPRARDMLAMRGLRYFNAVLWVLHALVFSLPLPIPFTNSLPAIVVMLLAVGTMEDDIAVIALAYVGVLVNVAFFASIVVLPMLGWRMMAS
ncbi:MAG TPA: exopolysaccharide biosynthesis protein [Candidatus Limnocylindrales bacterium]|nr:exopolysaccharide biosynthesis protein [Candidatus Limnocylindrales bacterium]